MNNDPKRCDYLFYQPEKEAEAKNNGLRLDQINPYDCLEKVPDASEIERWYSWFWHAESMYVHTDHALTLKEYIRSLYEKSKGDDFGYAFERFYDKVTDFSMLRFYQGEPESPFPLSDINCDQLFWGYEQCWLSFIRTDQEKVRRMIDDYFQYGYGDFAIDDGTPTSFKAVLLNRWGHWFGEYHGPNSPAFKKWYTENYASRPLNPKWGAPQSGTKEE